jgi:hypothetical protein
MPLMKPEIPWNADRLYRIMSPYCLQKQSDGKYLILNREYSPLGFQPLHGRKVDKETISFYMDITPQVAEELSFNGSQDLDSIYLYNDASNPINGGKAMEDYTRRLVLLMAIKAWY